MKNSSLIKLLIILFIISASMDAKVLFSTIAANAQTEDVTFETAPAVARPNSSLLITARSYAFNTDNALFAWFVNGRKISEGKGMNSFTLTTGDTGSQTSLRVVATAAGGRRIEKSITIRIADVDILWQAMTSAPIWYQGKALPSENSSVKIFALPHFIRGGRALSPSELIFQWSMDDDLMKNQSGRGKNYFTAQAANVSDFSHKVGLKVWNEDNTLTAEQTALIPVKKTEAIPYEDHPLEGPRYQAAVSLLNVFSGQDIKIKAEPYYFSKESPDDLLFEWLVNGSTIQKTRKQNILNFNSTEGVRSLIPVEISIKNFKTIFQEAFAKFNINVK